MDAFDRVLMSELASNCRVSFTDLAKKYDVSVNTIKKRVESLVEEGVIVAFDVQIPLNILGASFAVILLKLTPEWSKDAMKDLGKHPNIYGIASGFQPEAFALVVYRGNQELTYVLDRMRSLAGVADTELVPLLPPLSGGEIPSSKTLDNMKKIDWKILQALRWNGRIQLGDLAGSIGSSPASVRKRLEFLRKNNLINETILVNPSVAKGMVVMLALSFPDLSTDVQYNIDELLAKEFPDSYWLSWRVADRPSILLTFQVQSTKDVLQIRERALSIFEDASIDRELIVGVWEYFPDFRDDLIAEKLDAYK